MHVPIPTQDGEEDTNLPLVSETSSEGLTEPFLVCYILSSKEICHAPVGRGTEGVRGGEMKGQSGMASITHCATRRFFNGPTTSSSDTEREGLEILQGQQVNQQISGNLRWLRAKYGMSLA